VAEQPVAYHFRHWSTRPHRLSDADAGAAPDADGVMN
jgi:hypothetical protein